MTKWDELDKQKQKLQNLINLWDGKAQLPKDIILEIVSNALRHYARVENIEVENTPEGFVKLLRSCTYDSDKLEDADELDDRQLEFFAFSLFEYHVEVRRFGSCDDGRISVRLVKYNEKQVEAHLKLMKGEISKEEFRRQENEARYPTLEDKKELLEARMRSGVETNDIRVKKILRGYEDAPAEYKVLRVAVYESVGKTRMDEAHIEKVIDEKVKEMLKTGQINVKTYRRIQKITHKVLRQEAAGP